MMNGRHHWQPCPLQIQNAICQSLVIVDNVKLIGMGQQPVARALAKSPGLREPASQFAYPLFSSERIP